MYSQPDFHFTQKSLLSCFHSIRSTENLCQAKLDCFWQMGALQPPKINHPTPTEIDTPCLREENKEATIGTSPCPINFAHAKAELSEISV
uniref:Uncharacterized protein n=1 Tax=Arundo donax TaxID=35708 RepID=A0A0A9G7U7_ARUDO